MTISTGTLRHADITPADVAGLRTAREVERMVERRRRSGRQLAPQQPQGADRVVERAGLPPSLDRGAELPDQHVRVGRLIAASIDFVMQPARVRG